MTPDPIRSSLSDRHVRFSRGRSLLLCALLLSVSTAVADIEFIEPPPVDGPVAPYQSGHVPTAEESRELANQEREHWDEMMEEIERASDASRIREDELYRSTATERAKSDLKVDDYANENKIKNTRRKVSTSIGMDGYYEGHELLYYGRSGMIEYIVKFDGDGNVISPVTKTPAGRAAESARSFQPAHSSTMTWWETQDQFGNYFPYRVEFGNGGGYLLFNENGTNYQGERFDEAGTRYGGFLDPREYPSYGDPNGDLSIVTLASYATSTCDHCQDKVQAHNEIADEFNHISREMNQIAERHNRYDAAAIETKNYARSAVEMRSRYAHLSGVRAAKQTEGSAALNALLACDQQCPGTEEDQPYSAIIGSPIAGPVPPVANPFTPLISTPVATGSDVAGDGASCAGDAAMSVAADTIACSVHTRAKPNLGQTSDPNVVVTDTTAVPEEAGGGYDIEVKIHRSPDDNNLRQGCGDLPPDLISMGQDPDDSDSDSDSDISGDASGDFGDLEIFYTVSCNQVAKSHTRTPPSRITFRDYAQSGTAEGYLLGKRWGRKGREDHPDEQVTDAKAAFKLMQGLACGSGTGGPALPKTKIRFSDDALPLSERINLGTVGGADIDSILQGVEVGQAGLDTLTKLEYLKYKLENGLDVTAEDISDLAGSLDTLRGDRFEELGNVLGGISTNADRITKAGELVEQAGNIYEWIQLAEEGRDDPLKAAQAFSQYLGMLSEVAGKVPGMGEFVTKYAEAVASMQDDLVIINARTQLTNEIIAQVGTFRDQYPDLGLDDFYDDVAEGASETAVDGAREADLRNRDEKVSDERDALDDARDTLRSIEDCIEYNTARMAAIELTLPELAKKWDELPDQDALEQEVNDSARRWGFRDRWAKAGNFPQRGDRKRAADRVPGSPANWTSGELTDILGTNQYSSDRARQAARAGRSNRERLARAAEQLQEEYETARQALEDCGKRLKGAQQEYLQALRDYQSEYAYWTAYIDNNYNQAVAEAARASALAAVDAQITALGMGVINGEVRITITTVCEEDGTVLSRETTTRAAVDGDDEEMSDEEFIRRFGLGAPDDTGYQDDGEAPDLSEFDTGAE